MVMDVSSKKIDHIPSLQSSENSVPPDSECGLHRQDEIAVFKGTGQRDHIEGYIKKIQGSLWGRRKFCNFLFYESNQLKLLIKRLNQFCKQFRFRKDIRVFLSSKISTLRAGLYIAVWFILPISPGKRNYLLNHFSMFSVGEFDSGGKKKNPATLPLNRTRTVGY